MKTLRAIFRLLLFAAYTSLRISQIVLCSLVYGVDIRRSMRIRRSWARWLLPRIGIQMQVEGMPPEFPCLLMCNHRSYLDPAVLVHDVLAYPVSKAEVAGWPVIGYGAKVTGVLFLKRESIASRKTTLSGIAQKVKEGFPVILFPEGTTHALAYTTAFREGGFKLAASEGIPIVPAAIEYGSKEDYWVGDDTFLPHFLRRFGEKKIEVYVRYGSAIRDDDPKLLLKKSKSWIDAELAAIQNSFR